MLSCVPAWHWAPPALMRDDLQNESISISRSNFLSPLLYKPVLWGFRPCLALLFVSNPERRAQSFLKGTVVAFVPGEGMAFWVCSWQLHKEVSYALSCQELLTSLEEYQNEGYRAVFPESLLQLALPRTIRFQTHLFSQHHRDHLINVNGNSDRQSLNTGKQH